MLNELLKGNRRALSKAITLIESLNPEDQSQAKLLLQSLPCPQKPAFKIGFSGPPGAGKSSLIESFGQYLLEHSRKLAILAIDPSSQLTQGSLLGDKTRMQKLSQHEEVFIRPSPAKGHLGGITPHTREAVLLCEAAGFDTILIESVGVGQSESDITQVVDVLVLVLPPASGDELQALKRGLFELADLVLINKTDGELKNSAQKSRLSYESTFKLMGRSTPVLCVSAHEKTGFDKLWQALSQFLPLLLLMLLTSCAEPKLDTQQIIKDLQSHNMKKSRKALIKITQNPDPKALDAVIAYAEHKSSEERIQAILAARQMGDTRAIPWLFVLSTGHADELVRNAAHDALTFLKKQAKRASSP